MKLNNKGFAISSIMYVILVLAVILISVTLALLSSRKIVLDKLKQEVINELHSICKLISGTEKAIGSKYECEVKPGTKYNFYVLSSESDGTTNLIMERNICSDGTVATEDRLCSVPWADSVDYGCGSEYDYCSKNDKGPITAMKYLNDATKDWIKTNNLDISYNDEGGHFSNFKITGKARMPYLSEVSNYDSTNKTNAFLYDYLQIKCWDYVVIEEVACEISPNIEGVYAPGIEHINELYGYWILSSSDANLYQVYYIDYYGIYSKTSTYAIDHYGVRPVINVNL